MSVLFSCLIVLPVFLPVKDFVSLIWNVLYKNVNKLKDFLNVKKILEWVYELRLWVFILVYVLQASKLSIHAIENKPAEELPVLTSAELEEITDPNVIINKMITLETQSAQMKPNLGAIAEYKKKVCININGHASILTMAEVQSCVINES